MSTERVALLIGVPVTQAGFQRAWQRGSDYLSNLTAAYGDLARAWSAYAESAAIAERLCRECAGLGATVVLDATLDDLGKQIPRHEATVLVTHMTFPTVAPEDVLNVAAFLERMSTGREGEFALLRSVLPDPFDLTDALRGIDHLLTLSDRSREAEPLSDLRDADVVVRQRGAMLAEFGLIALDRPRLDELCGPTVLAPARGIELSGTMVTAAQFIAAFPPEHAGMVDLRMCRSISLGTALRRARPHMRIAVSQRPAHIEAGLILTKTALLYLEQQRRRASPRGAAMTYEAAMRAVIDALKPQVEAAK